MKPGCTCLILNLTDLAASCSNTDQDIMLNLKASLPSLVNRFFRFANGAESQLAALLRRLGTWIKVIEVLFLKIAGQREAN